MEGASDLMTQYYYQYDKVTRVVMHKPISAFIGSKLPQVPRDALTIEPLRKKEGFVVIACEFDERGKPFLTKYIEDHRGEIIYDQTNCNKSETVTELGEIKEGWTELKPITQFDEWINNDWVTNQSNKYIAEYNQVDNVRRGLYAQICDPLIAEANIKRLQGFEDDAQAIEAQVLAARNKIQTENPWPTPPSN